MALLTAAPAAAVAQVEARPLLRGTVFVADTPMVDGTVVLHHLSQGEQGEVDSVRVGQGGVFAFALPGVPDPAREDVYFASVMHDDVLYFGPMITTALDLDSVYEVHAYDSLVAPAEGAEVALASRSIFLEPDGVGSWRATDLFQLRNDTDRTIVARPDGRTWAYPLPPEATDVQVGEGEMSADAVAFDGGAIAARAALPPGDRLFVVRYTLESPFIGFPTPGVTDILDVLLLEPAPPVEVEGLEAVDRIELEGGSVFQRFSAEAFSGPSVTLVPGEDRGPPPVEWIAVVLAMVLALGGLAAFRAGGPRPAPAPASRSASRQEILLEVARLDEDFESRPERSAGARRAYERRRRELLDRLGTGA